jgi:hypothetical protein
MMSSGWLNYGKSAPSSQQMMRGRSTLFLDFDGVLHPNFHPPHEAFNLAPLLAEALAGSSVQIIISSSWRFDCSLSELQGLLPKVLAERVVGTTGAPFEGEFARWNEICETVRHHSILDWRALDDSKLEFPSALCPELILCDGRRGLTEPQCAEIARWLALPD